MIDGRTRVHHHQSVLGYYIRYSLRIFMPCFALAGVGQYFIILMRVHGNVRAGSYVGMVNSADGANAGVRRMQGRSGIQHLYVEAAVLMIDFCRIGNFLYHALFILLLENKIMFLLVCGMIREVKI